MPQPRISICIPTYNRAYIIGETLDCLLLQNRDDVEIVISDNASTDNTCAVVEGYRKRFSKLVYSRSDSNMGPDANAIRAARIAQGEYIWFLSDDDLIVDGGINLVLENYLAKNDLDMMLLTYGLYDITMTTLLSNSADQIGVTSDISTRDVIGFFKSYFCEICMSAYIVKRKLWLDGNPDRFLNTGMVIVGAAYDGMNDSSLIQLVYKTIVKYRSNHLCWEDVKLEVLLSSIPNGVKLISSRYDSAKADALLRFYKRFPVSLTMLLRLRADMLYDWHLYRKYVSPYFGGRILKQIAAALISIFPPRALALARLAVATFKRV